MVNYRVDDGEILVGDFDHPDYWRTMRQDERVDVLEAMVKPQLLITLLGSSSQLGAKPSTSRISATVILRKLPVRWLPC